MKSHLFHLHALSALHVGVGQAIGNVDLPIARERASHLPFVPGSGIKGVLRDAWTERDKAGVSDLFGPERIDKGDDAFTGALAIGDAKLLLLPVRSLAGVMAWATCPFVLRRYRADHELTHSANRLPKIPEVEGGHARITAGSTLNAEGTTLVLDDLDIVADNDHAAADAWAEHFRQSLFAGGSSEDIELAKHHFDSRFVILSDDDFAFLAETGTEIRARVRIDPGRGVVEDGALWYEENLPAETVLWGLIGVGRSRDGTSGKSGANGNGNGNGSKDAASMSQQFTQHLKKPLSLQMGGKATIGRGLVRFSLVGA
ncbi:MAG TPA: type III-B CRISPR module RAMP protein Cmr4 [Xanthomonadales bacterium]|nr:type III-B CRISPR module RAMP protein Cmr4 [Xanthomonadales bacterium]